MKTLTHVSRCEEHTFRIDGYIAFFADCEARARRGECQAFCDECNLYVWPRIPVAAGSATPQD